MIRNWFRSLYHWAEEGEFSAAGEDQSPAEQEESSVCLDESNAWLAEVRSDEGFVPRFLSWLGTPAAAALYRDLYRVFAAVICLTVTIVLLVTVPFLPEFGNPDNPANNEVSERYIERGLEETGATNIVAGMILDYRAFDTLGESNVLFAAMCSVAILLRVDRKGKEANIPEIQVWRWDGKANIYLRHATKILIPVTMIFGIFVVLNGHLSAGGGFSGGTILGASLILLSNAFGSKRLEHYFSNTVCKWLTFAALMAYACLKSYSFFTGANHLESGISLGTPGALFSAGLILPLNLCVGCVVACTMYSFYAMFRSGGIEDGV